jgi:hypothetical protein
MTDRNAEEAKEVIGQWMKWHKQNDVIDDTLLAEYQLKQSELHRHGTREGRCHIRHTSGKI